MKAKRLILSVLLAMALVVPVVGSEVVNPAGVTTVSVAKKKITKMKAYKTLTKWLRKKKINYVYIEVERVTKTKNYYKFDVYDNNPDPTALYFKYIGTYRVNRKTGKVSKY